MKISVRLYRQHDMDLVSLYLNDEFNFAKEMKNSVYAVIHDKPYVVKVPDYAPHAGYLKRAVLLHFDIPDTDTEMISRLEGIKAGQRCSFFKSALRACLDRFPYMAYFKGDGIIISKNEATRLENKKRQDIFDENNKGDNHEKSKVYNAQDINGVKGTTETDENPPERTSVSKTKRVVRSTERTQTKESSLTDAILRDMRSSSVSEKVVPDTGLETDYETDDNFDDEDLFAAISSVSGGN